MGPFARLQYDIAGTLGNGSWGYNVVSDSAALGIERHVSGIADTFNGHIDAFRIAHVQRSDGWIETAGTT